MSWLVSSCNAAELHYEDNVIIAVHAVAVFSVSEETSGVVYIYAYVHTTKLALYTLRILLYLRTMAASKAAHVQVVGRQRSGEKSIPIRVEYQGFPRFLFFR